MTLAKRKVSFSLEEDLVEELEPEHRRRQRLLVELLDRLDAEQGPADEALVEKYVDLLS